MSEAPLEEIRESPSRSPAVEVKLVTDADAEAVAAFFRRVWSDSSTADEVRRARRATAASNLSVPQADPPAVVYLRDGEALGYLGTIPVSFWNGSVDVPGYWLKGFMVLPEFRNGPIGYSMLKELLKHIDVSGILTVATPARRLFAAVGYTDCGVLPNFIGVLNPGRVAANLDLRAIGLGFPSWLHRLVRVSQRVGLATAGGYVAGSAFHLRRLVRLGDRERCVVSDDAPLIAEDVDRLWQRARDGISAAAVRSAGFLGRYASTPGETYTVVQVREARDGRLLRALAVVRRPSQTPDARLRGIRVATLADILFCPDDPEAGRAAVAGAESVARRMGADALVCSTSHEAIAGVLVRRAWLRLPGNVHLMLRDPARRAGVPSEIGDWWIMRGDASADEAF